MKIIILDLFKIYIYYTSFCLADNPSIISEGKKSTSEADSGVLFLFLNKLKKENKCSIIYKIP